MYGNRLVVFGNSSGKTPSVISKKLGLNVISVHDRPRHQHCHLLLKNDALVGDWLERTITQGETLALSTLSVVGLLGFKKLPQSERFVIQQLLQTMVMIDVDIIIAHQAAALRQQYNLRTVDSVIAATAKTLSAELVSRDKSFQKIKTLRLLQL